jgi:hypothetical protein
MVKVLKEEKFEDSDWNDVAQVVTTSLCWFIANIEIPKKQSQDSNPPLPKKLKKPSQSKKKHRND